jgi:hypothetical protein
VTKSMITKEIKSIIVLAFTYMYCFDLIASPSATCIRIYLSHSVAALHDIGARFCNRCTLLFRNSFWTYIL